MRTLQTFLICVFAMSPALALAASPSPLLGLPPDCRVTNDRNDADRVIEGCTSGLKSSDASGEKRAWLLFFRAYAYVEQGRIEEANIDLNAAVAADPSIDNLYHELSYVRTELGDFDGAEAAASKAMELAPTSMEHPKERAFARLQKGDYAGAIADYTRAVSAAEDPAVRQILAYAHAMNGDIEAARADLAKVGGSGIRPGSYGEFASKVLLTLSPADQGGDAKGRCAKTFDGNFGKDSTRACTAAIRTAATPVDRANALRARSLTWLYGVELGDAAKTDIEAAVRFNPNNDATVGQRCMVLTNTATVKRQVERAIRDCTRALELCSGDTCAVSHRANRANAYLTIDDFKSALADAEFVIKTWPNADDGYRIRGEAKLGLGDKDGAKADLTKARRLGGRSDHLKKLLAQVGVNMDDIPVDPK